jgi:4-phosphopantoate--beta-alanine ligase
MIREKLVNGVNNGLVVKEGLIAHGRGEAFDYLLGEQTIDIVEIAEKAAAAHLVLADKPVISINGNTAALVPEGLAELVKILPSARLEVNIFHYTPERVNRIIQELKKYTNNKIEILGDKPDAKIPGLDYSRAHCSEEGIFSSDVIFVPLEDGDRAKALVEMGKIVITIDLNPLSRTARTASVTLVDNIVRAVPNMIKYVKGCKKLERSSLEKIVNDFNNEQNLKQVLAFIASRINKIGF